MNSADGQALRQACGDVARPVMWDLRPADTDRIHDLADRFFEEASKRATPVDSSDDPNTISTYAIPPMKDDVGWFGQALDLLGHIVYPSNDPDREARAFLADLEAGIVRWRALSGESREWGVVNPLETDGPANDQQR